MTRPDVRSLFEGQNLHVKEIIFVKYQKHIFLKSLIFKMYHSPIKRLLILVVLL